MIRNYIKKKQIYIPVFGFCSVVIFVAYIFLYKQRQFVHIFITRQNHCSLNTDLNKLIVVTISSVFFLLKMFTLSCSYNATKYVWSMIVKPIDIEMLLFVKIANPKSLIISSLKSVYYIAALLSCSIIESSCRPICFIRRKV